jgi:hypothetical protein
MSRISSEEVTRELHLLRGFLNSLRAGSLVHGRLSSLIDELTLTQTQEQTHTHMEHMEHMEHMQHTDTQQSVKGPVGTVGAINVSVVVKHVAYTTPKSISMLSSTTLSTLRGYIETTNGPKFELERLLVKRTGKAWCTFDNKTVSQCEIKDGDLLIADCKSAVETLNPTGLERLKSTRITPTNAFELVACALHCFLLDEAFVAVVELPNATPGFAPSLKGTHTYRCI